MTELDSTIACIRTPLDPAAARMRLDSLTKPRGSLGRLEDLATQLAMLGITSLSKAVYVFAADHGLAQEGVSAYPSAVTRQMVLNFLAGGAAINVLARQHEAALHVVDCGVAEPLPDHALLLKHSVRAGSRNMLHEPAMTKDELEQALAAGLACAVHAARYNLVAVGEMGIGNTSSASLLTAALSGRPLHKLTGAGTGLDTAGRMRKLAVLERVLAMHGTAVQEPREILRVFGGLEIAAMTGFMIGAAANGSAILVDGFISTAAAAFALALAPEARPYLIVAHVSAEPAHRLLLASLGMSPLLDLSMRLGEGTGAVLAMPIVASALALYAEMATFSSASVSEATA